MSERKSFRIPEGYRTSIILLLAIAIGVVLGTVFGEKILWIKPFGTIFINVCFTISVPTVMFSIISSVAQINSMNRLGKILKYTLLVFASTGICAGVLIILWCKVVPMPSNIGEVLPIMDAEITEFTLGDRIASALTVTDFSELFSKSHILPLIIACLVVGTLLAQSGEKAKNVIATFDLFSEICMKIVGLMMKYLAPIGLVAYFASLVANLGPEIMGFYAHIALKIFYPVAILYFLFGNFIYASLAGGVKLGLRYVRRIIPVAATAFGTQSSLAALPGNLDAAKDLGVPRDIRSVVLPLGATAHMDGAVLSNIMKIAILFAMCDRPFTGIVTYIESIIICVFSGVVISAIPGAGMIGAVIIMGFFGFPQEHFPVIASLTFILDPFGTLVNCAGDCTASMLVARLVEGKDWVKRNLTADEE